LKYASDLFDFPIQLELNLEEQIAQMEIHFDPTDMCYVFSCGAHVRSTHKKGIPKTLQEALRMPDRDKWLASIETEIRSTERQDTHKWVQKPLKESILRTNTLFDLKTDNFNVPIKHKTRIVVQGNMQKYRETSYEVYAPASTPTLYAHFFAPATESNWGIRQFDFSTAYLNAPLSEKFQRKYMCTRPLAAVIPTIQI
jgi:hypothetical protein